MPTYNPNDFYPKSGAEIDSNGNVKNDADGLNSDGSKNVVLVKSNAQDAVSVTPSDTNQLTTVPTKGIYIGVSGDVKVMLNSGNTVTFSGLSSGVIHPLAVKQIFSTGTTASNILAVY